MIARIWNILLTVFLLIAAALVVAFAGVRLVGLAPYAVLSGSMEPEYPVGSLIYVKDVSPSSVEVGQAITFRQGSGSMVTHQVYEIDSEQQLFYTQGIANVDSNGEVMHDAAPTPWSSLVGEPIACVPYLGYVNDWITHAPGIYVIVAFVAVIMATSVALELRRMTLEKRRAEEFERYDEELRQPSGIYGQGPVRNVPHCGIGCGDARVPSYRDRYGDVRAPGYGAEHGAGCVPEHGTGYAGGYDPGYGAAGSGYEANRGSAYAADQRRVPYGATPDTPPVYREYSRPNQGFANVNPPQVGPSGRRGAHARPQGGARSAKRR